MTSAPRSPERTASSADAPMTDIVPNSLRAQHATRHIASRPHPPVTRTAVGAVPSGGLLQLTPTRRTREPILPVFSL